MAERVDRLEDAMMRLAEQDIRTSQAAEQAMQAITELSYTVRDHVDVEHRSWWKRIFS